MRISWLRWTLPTGLAIVALLTASRATAAEPSREELAHFEKQIRPLLVERCVKCHGEAKQRGGLRLDTRAGTFEGGESGPAVVPGKSSESLLIQAVRHEGLTMPPDGKLADREVELLINWVERGAAWPKDLGAAVSTAKRKPGVITEDDRNWWSFRPVAEPAIPTTNDGGWARGPIDRFVWAAMTERGLAPAPEADPLVLVRRAYFDLIGLPPTNAEVAAYLNDAPETRWERLIDRLLANPHYGAKQARYWLDLVRYADSDGYRIDHVRPQAYRYRDYVIASFNSDQPYDRFVQEQLAGDELFPGDSTALVATGYLRHGIYEYNNRDAKTQWELMLNDVTDTTSDVFLGLSLQCAKCHDHKFDPLLQKDYFRLQSFFAPLLPRDDAVIANDAERSEYAERLAKWEAAVGELKRELAEIEAPFRKAARADAVSKFPDDVQSLLEADPAALSPYERQVRALAHRQIDLEYVQIEGKLKGDAKERAIAIRKEMSKFESLKPAPLAAAMVAGDVDVVPPPTRMPKGAKELVEPASLEVLAEGPIEASPVDGRSTGRRAALARWLTNPGNPLTSRVIANRMWAWRFGQGLAAQTSDFGRLGSAPSHPELLDWLAVRLQRGGWSLKRLHRELLLTATYRQTADSPRSAEFSRIDPENRFYWRGHVRRMQAEEIRDSLLATTDELDDRLYGPGANSNEPRRSIYLKQLRNTRDSLLDVFDLPQFFQSAADRPATTTPVQSLLLINSQQLLQRGAALARLVEREATSDRDRVDAAYRRAFGRPATSDELDRGSEFVRRQQAAIDPQEAGSAEAAFLFDRIPHRDGQAAIVDPDGPQRGFEAGDRPMSLDGDLTVEAYFLLRSVYEGGNVRTIVANWGAGAGQSGWAFGVTGRGSRRKPQTLVLQMYGRHADGTIREAALFSDHLIQFDRPYYAAVSMERATNERPGRATFHLKDLANDDEPLLTAVVEHGVMGEYAAATRPVTIGGRPGNSAFDGLLDDVRLTRAALPLEHLLFTTESTRGETIGFWRFESQPDVFHDSSGRGAHLRPSERRRSVVDLRRSALEDFCHVLLNSNEMIYVP